MSQVQILFEQEGLGAGTPEEAMRHATSFLTEHPDVLSQILAAAIEKKILTVKPWA